MKVSMYISLIVFAIGLSGIILIGVLAPSDPDVVAGIAYPYNFMWLASLAICFGGVLKPFFALIRLGVFPDK